MQNLSESQTERRNKVTLNHGLSRGGYVGLEERIVIYFLNHSCFPNFLFQLCCIR